MSFETLEWLTRSALSNSDAKFVTFIWHGGEPLIRGREFFQTAIELQARYRREGQGVANCLQTNGTLVNQSWTTFFKEHGWNIGLSIDGPAQLHDVQRPRVNGAGSSSAAMQALRMLQADEVSCGVLLVATDSTLAYGPDRMFDWLLENHVRNFAFLRLRPESRPDGRYAVGHDYLGLPPFLRYQQRIFDRWYALQDPRISIREFEGILTGLAGGRAAICTLAGDCLGRHLGVNVNGDIYHCDRYVSDRDYLLGSAHKFDFERLSTDPTLSGLRAQNSKRLVGYRACPWLDICNGGCPHDAYVASRSSSGADPDCCGQAALIEYIASRVYSSLTAIEP